MSLTTSSSRLRRLRLLFLLAGLWLCIFQGAAALATVPEVSESQVKAAFLFNFAKFVEWPPSAFAASPGTITLGILEREPLAPALEALAGKEVQGRRLVVKRCRHPQELKTCQIFYASAAEKAALAATMAALKGLPVLTVTDDVDDFASLGGMINLIRQEDKIRFYIDVTNAQRSGLKISSQLLKLAIRGGS